MCVHARVRTVFTSLDCSLPVRVTGARPPRDALTLASQVTSALQPLRPAVHPVQSASGDAATTVSWLLLGLPRPVPVATVSVMLDEVVKRVYEVINIQVQGTAPSLRPPLGGGHGGGCRTDGPAGEGRPDLSLALSGPNQV